MNTLAQIEANVMPPEMRERHQWVSWRPMPRGDKTLKLPLTPGTLRSARTTDPRTWGTFVEALADVEAGRATGVGFVFMREDPFFGIDLDKCVDPVTGLIEPWALAIVERFQSYTEISPSGTGLHIIGYGMGPDEGTRRDSIEYYPSARYFTMTGSAVPGFFTLRERSDVLQSWHRATFAGKQVVVSPEIPAASVADVTELLRAERTGKPSAWLRGDWSGYRSPSEARWALANRVLFYGGNVEAVESILLTSGLFEPGDSNMQRARKARHDATKAATDYAGPRYDPKWTAGAPQEMSPSDTSLGLAAPVLANAALKGMRLTAIAVLADLGTRIAKGESPSSNGFRIPAARYALWTGQTESTVAKHLRDLSGLELMPKERLRIRTTHQDMLETVEGSTGEIRSTPESVRGTRHANFLRLPEDGLEGLTARLTAYPAALETAESGSVDSNVRVSEEGVDQISSQSSVASLTPHSPCVNYGASDAPEKIEFPSVETTRNRFVSVGPNPNQKKVFQYETKDQSSTLI